MKKNRTEIGERLKILRGNKTQSEFATEIGTTLRAYQYYEAGDRVPNIELLTEISKRYNKSIDWILKGIDKSGDEHDPQEEFVYVPQVSGKISAGGGLVPENHIEMKIAFRRAWIMKRGDPKNMALIKVSGDSMEPTLQSGDLVLVDHSRDYLDPHGGIYAIAVDDTLMIKRLQPEYPNKKVQIISDNPKYKVMEAMIDQIHINGKVIWFGREIER